MSDVWKFFENGTESYSFCKLCLETKSREEAKIGRNQNTSRLWRHLNDNHSEHTLYREYNQIKKESGEKFNQSVLKLTNKQLDFSARVPPSKTQIDLHISRMIAMDCQPYSVIKDEGFLALVRLAFPKYEMPGRDYFVSNISKMYHDAKERLVTILKSSHHVALTSDMWSSNSNESFITLTASFISGSTLHNFVLETLAFGNVSHNSENLSIYLQAAISRWSLSNKVIAIITDNASNITNAVEASNNVSLRCAAHTLQLCVKDGLDKASNIEQMLSKCRAIVGHFKKSPKAYQALAGYQESLGIEKHKLIQEVPTRWNSTFYMLQRLREQRKAINLYFSETEINISALSGGDYEQIDELLTLLDPLEQATVELSGDKYCSLLLVLPIVTHLTVQLKSSRVGEKLKKVREQLIQSIKSRLSDIEVNPMYFKATLLDPRIKDSCFIEERNKLKAIRDLMTELRASEAAVTKSTTPTNLEPQNPQKRRKLLDFVRDQQVGRECTENLNDMETELNNYLRDPCLVDERDVISWWKANEDRFPNLYILSLKYLCLPATSCPSERVFSKAGEIISKKRSRITSKHANELIFLSHNLKKLE